MITKLARKPYRVGGIAKDDEQFMLEAKELLGYQLLDNRRVLAVTARVFKKLGIEPIDPMRVALYKNDRVQRVRRMRRWKDEFGRWVTSRTSGEWIAKQLKGYSQPVPDFAILRASQVKKELFKNNVDANFEIHEFHVEHKTVVDDPFMVLVVAGERFYLDVWNEPKFEGRRTI